MLRGQALRWKTQFKVAFLVIEIERAERQKEIHIIFCCIVVLCSLTVVLFVSKQSWRSATCWSTRHIARESDSFYWSHRDRFQGTYLVVVNRTRMFYVATVTYIYLLLSFVEQLRKKRKNWFMIALIAYSFRPL